MTGGQMAPTTIEGQITATTPWGRKASEGDGWPLKISEMLAQLNGVNFVARASMHNPAEIKKALHYMRQAFQRQEEKKGFSLVEVLSACPTIWRKTPPEAVDWIEKTMIKVFPLGLIKG